jgi:hypothetical protein
LDATGHPRSGQRTGAREIRSGLEETESTSNTKVGLTLQLVARITNSAQELNDTE